jgi:protein TonB
MFVGLMAVAGLHIVAILALKSGLVQDVVQDFTRPFTTVIVDPIPIVEEPPPPPPVQPMQIELPVIPHIPIEIEIPESAPSVSPVSVADASPVTQETGPATGEGPQIVEFQVDSRYPLTRPYYPPEEIRMGREGLVTLMIYVMPNGRVGEAKVATSSGYRKLDASALREALKSWRFKPRMEGGRAVGSWGSFKVRFRLD